MVLSPAPPSPGGLGTLTPVPGSPGNPVVSPAAPGSPAGPEIPPVVSDVDTIPMVVGQPAVGGAGPATTGSGTASPDPPGGQPSQTFRSGTGGVSISGGGGRPVTTQQPGSTAPGTPSPPKFPPLCLRIATPAGSYTLSANLLDPCRPSMLVVSFSPTPVHGPARNQCTINIPAVSNQYLSRVQIECALRCT